MKLSGSDMLTGNVAECSRRSNSSAVHLSEYGGAGWASVEIRNRFSVQIQNLSVFVYSQTAEGMVNTGSYRQRIERRCYNLLWLRVLVTSSLSVVPSSIALLYSLMVFSKAPFCTPWTSCNLEASSSRVSAITTFPP